MFSPRVAWSLALGCVAWQAVARIGQMVDVATTYAIASVPLLIVGSAVIAGLVTAQLSISIGRGPRHLLLVAMVAFTLAPAPVLGGAWPAIGGLVGAAILLTVRSRWSATLLGAVLGADALAYWLFSDSSGAILASRTLMNLNVALALFVVIRLARLIQQIHDTRVDAAQALVEVEKQRSAQWLRSALGSRLAELITVTRRMSAEAVFARDDLAHLARAARRAAETARRTVDARSRARLPPLADGPVATTNDYALSWAVSAIITIIFGSVAGLNLLWLGDPTPTMWVITIGVALCAGALHLYHGTPRPDGGIPRWWPWTLTAQALIMVPAVWAAGEALFLPYFGLLAGSAATRLRGPWLWLLPPVAFVLGPAIAAQVLPSWTSWAAANVVGSLATVMITLYALCHLPWVAALLRQTRAAFAWTAVATERSNFARDVHDLLGFHLAAMVHNAELAVRTPPADRGTTRERLDTVQLCAERAMTDLRSIHDRAAPHCAREEIAEAASLLRAVGIRVTVNVPEDNGGGADDIAAIVVREASTNIVRHARASRCTFRLRTSRDGEVDLLIVNDGADVPATGPGTGRGLGNLTGRVELAGGRLTTSHTDATFRLTVHIPAQSTAATPALVGSLPGGQPAPTPRRRRATAAVGAPR